MLITWCKSLERCLVISSLLIISVNFAYAANKSAFTEVHYLSGANSSLKLFIYKNDTNLDLSKAPELRFKLNPSTLYKSNFSSSSFEVKAYEIVNGDRNLITTINPTIRKTQTSLVFSLPMNSFETDQKKLEIDIYNTSRTFVNTYSLTVNAKNLDSQSNVTSTGSNCSDESLSFENFFDNVVFEIKPQKSIATNVVKLSDCKYKVIIPLPRKEVVIKSSKPKQTEGNALGNTSVLPIFSGGTNSGTANDISADGGVSAVAGKGKKSGTVVPDSVIVKEGAQTLEDKTLIDTVLSGTFTFKDGNEAAGKVLTSDLNGNVSWKSLPVVSGGGAGPAGPPGPQGPAGSFSGGSATVNGTLSLTGTVGNIFAVNGSTLVADATNRRIGIGTTAPLLKLDVAGSGRFTGTATSVLTGSIDPIASTTITGVGTLFTTELIVGDRITVSGETRTVTAIASNTSLTVDTATTNTANDTSPDKLAAIFVARDSASAPKLVINDLGNVGIGITAPVAKLHINGQVLIAGGTPGAGKVLTSDANGLASWAVAGGSLFTDGGATTYLTSLTDDFAIGANSLTAPFSVDESLNTVRIGEGANSNGTLAMYASDGDTGTIAYTTNDSWDFEGGNIGIGTTIPLSRLHVNPTANTQDVIYIKRFTDASPTGAALNVRRADNATSAFYVETSGLTSIGAFPANSMTSAELQIYAIRLGDYGPASLHFNVTDTDAGDAVREAWIGTWYGPTSSKIPLGFDASTFYFATGNVGIGVTSPAGILHVATSTTALGQSIFEQASADADSYDFNFRKTRGTVAAPTVITTADELGVINFRGYSGAAGYVTGAAIKGISEGTIATTRVPAHLSFWTGTDAAPTVLTERMRIDKVGNVGIGTTTVNAKLAVNNTIVFVSEFNNGNSGAAKTIDWNNGNKQLVTLNANTTLTFTAPGGVINLVLRVVQDGTGSRTATWPAAVKWPGGIAPTLSTAAAAEDVISCYYNGTSYYCLAGLNFL